MTMENVLTRIGWKFDNSYARLPQLFFAEIDPTPVRSPEWVVLNEPLAIALGFNVQALKSEEGIEVLAGNRIPEGAIPIAQAYAGHQFGHFTMLGDGRALLIGEQMAPTGNRVDIQLKGSGRTPYSRGGDGRAVLGPMLREYIISEAMHALGIPTTRSLAVVTTGETVFRDGPQPGAILTRVAASHLRVGTFQYVSNWGSLEDLRLLADYTIARHFPSIASDEYRYLQLLKEVAKRQAFLIAQWQRVGFIHGVMNTDNMAISGETIDYGPCAFMDTYDPATVFSSIDVYGRYAYGNQPDIAAWNLARFAETLLPLLHDQPDQAAALAQEEISVFVELYHHHWLSCMRAKLGITNEENEDESLINDLLRMMKEYDADFTNTFRALTLNDLEDTPLFGLEEFNRWYEMWQTRQSRQQASKADIGQLMRKSNPAIIPRNHRVEEALEAAVKHDDTRVMERLLDALSNPSAYSPEQMAYTAPPEPSACPYRTFCGT